MSNVIYKLKKWQRTKAAAIRSLAFLVRRRLLSSLANDISFVADNDHHLSQQDSASSNVHIAYNNNNNNNNNSICIAP